MRESPRSDLDLIDGKPPGKRSQRVELCIARSAAVASRNDLEQRWTPSPNEASRLLEAIMTLPVPRIVGDPGDALGVVIDERRTEDAFIPAKMLLGFAPRFGWEKARISDETARLESAESIRKGQLKRSISKFRAW